MVSSSSLNSNNNNCHNSVFLHMLGHCIKEELRKVVRCSSAVVSTSDSQPEKKSTLGNSKPNPDLKISLPKSSCPLKLSSLANAL